MEGAPLAELGRSEYETRLHQAQANLATADMTIRKLETVLEMYEKTLPAEISRAEAALASARAVFKEAEKNRERYENLVRENVVSEQEWEAVYLHSETAHARLKEMEAQLHQTRSNMKKIDTTRKEIAAWEQLGKEKRHLLADQVEDVRDEQGQASEEFKDVLSRLKSMYGFDGGELESFYLKLQDDYESCADRAESLEDRIDNVKTIGADLFAEWEGEIDMISNPKFKSQSRRNLTETRQRFAKLERSMDRSRASMNPVLQQLSDYVLYLKHNLNARAVGALKQEADDIELGVSSLIQDMQTSIDEADRFLEHFEKG